MGVFEGDEGAVEEVHLAGVVVEGLDLVLHLVQVLLDGFGEWDVAELVGAEAQHVVVVVHVGHGFEEMVARAEFSAVERAVQVLVAEVVTGDLWDRVVVGDNGTVQSGHGVAIVVAVLRGHGPDGTC